jgi:L-asparaginase II
MRAHPMLVEGPTWFDTIIMESLPGTTSKSGAEGLGCVSLPDGRGFSVKVVDGADRAMEPAALAVLAAAVGADAIPGRVRALSRPPIKNDAGDVVGELLAVVPG